MTTETPDRETLWERLSEYTLCDGMLAAKCKAEFARILADVEAAAGRRALAAANEKIVARAKAVRHVEDPYLAGAVNGYMAAADIVDTLAAGLPGGADAGGK